MATPEQYLQTQMNDVQTSLAAHNILTKNALDAAGDNKRALKAAHQRLDTLHDQLQLLNANQITKKDIEEVMSTSFNKRLAAAIKGFFVTTLGGGIAASVAWAVEHLTGR